VGTTKLGPTLADRGLTAKAGVALLLANARYWPTVAPIVREQLKHWERGAAEIPDATLRALALNKIHEERFNAEVAATLATLAPRAHRKHTVQAIVALEVMYDYLDGLTEQPTNDPLRDNRQLSLAFTDAISLEDAPYADYYRYHPGDDGGYLQALARTVRLNLAQLPAAGTIADTARASVARCSEAQIQVHAAQRIGTSQLKHWATHEATGTPLEWRAFIAGAVASILAVHALIAAAADHHTTCEQAVAIEEAYLPISALSTMLDSLIDHELDLRTGAPWFLDDYDQQRISEHQLSDVARAAIAQTRPLPNSGHHLMTLIGVVAYYTSAPAAKETLAKPLVAHIQRELQPLMTPTLAVMTAWRTAKRLRRAIKSATDIHTGPERS
jgi:tetraprenyl-beta-curcumene synthase